MKLSGRKVIVATPILSFFLFSLAGAVLAETNVNVKSSGGTGKTDIVIECNGVKKEYHSDKAENVTLNCDDSILGTVKNEIKITSDTSPTTKVTANPKQIEELKKKTDDIKKETKAAKDKIKEERKDLFEQMTQFFRELFKNFHF